MTPRRAARVLRLAACMDKIPRGARPGALPVEQPTEVEPAMNLRTAKAPGFAIPHPLLLRADQVFQ